MFALASSQFFASETAGVATLRVVRSMPNVFPRPPGAFLGSGVTVDFVVTGGTATNGADFTLATGRITFGANETFKDIVIPLAGDGVAEGLESVVVGLISTATLTIVD